MCSFCVKKVFRTQKSSKENSPLGQSFGPSTSLAPPFTIRLSDGNGPMIVHNVTESGQVCNSTEVPEGPRGRRQPRRMAGKSQQPPASAGGLVFLKNFVGGTKSINDIFGPVARCHGPVGKAGCSICRRELCGGSSPAVPLFFGLGGLARSQISARIGARQSNRRGNLSRGVFPYSSRITYTSHTNTQGASETKHTRLAALSRPNGCALKYQFQYQKYPFQRSGFVAHL